MTILGVDAGGTFTDFVCVETGSKNSLRIYKTLSTPHAPEEAILSGIHGLGLSAELESGGLHIIHGSTVATNATLEGKVAKTVFVSNYGFKDMLRLARQTRPELYALEFEAVQPPVPPELCLETGGRLAADGSVVEALSEAEISALVAKVSSLEPEAVAINLLFSFLDDEFEKRLEAALKKNNPATFLSRSSAVLPVYKEYERGIATWLNASLAPIVHGYLSRLSEQLNACPLQIMQSSGETIAADKASDLAVHLLLSGPAGGLTAIQFLGQQIEEEKIISFDMGGTSTDVALMDGEISTTTEGRIDRFPVGVPMVDMHTIGAGGGSIAFIDSGDMLKVGPQSAGANPGPASYDNGGKFATVTDANLVLGRLLESSQLAGGLSLNLSKARSAIEKLSEPLALSIEETALGIVTIANEHMAKAIRLISVNRGHDPKEFVLASFGGAGGLHVCAIAEAMQMNKAIVPAYGGVLSALGMLVADRGRQFTRTVGVDADSVAATELDTQFQELAQQGSLALQQEGLLKESLETKYSADCRYRGQSYTLNVVWNNLPDCCQAFTALHKQRYGYDLNTTIEIVNIRVNVISRARPISLPDNSAAAGCNNCETIKVYGSAEPAKVFRRDELQTGTQLEGPAIIIEYSATTYIASGWRVRVDQYSNLLLAKINS
ncbi:MAG: hydantoinase/oxoprolinase family protein [Pseudomonadales bacterium]|nr:hydantoinase/oxoprolinase family protein [Pseudomonadales bacterium]